MFWYILIICIFFYPLSLSFLGKQKAKNLDHLIILICSTVLCFFMALRSEDVGADTRNYIFIFRQISSLNFKDALFGNLYLPYNLKPVHIEIGYRLYNRIIGAALSKNQAILVCNSVVTIALLTKLTTKAPNPVLTFWLYVTLGIYQTQMNMSRNAIAILICYCALEYAKEKNLIKFLLLIMVAASFHLSALLFIPIYWLQFIRIDKKIMMSLISIAVVLAMSFELIKPFIKKYLPSFWLNYLYVEGKKPESIILGLFYSGLLAVIYLFLDKNEKNRFFSESKLYLWIFLANIIAICFSLSVSAAAGRVAALFGPYLMLSIPEIIKNSIKKESKVLRVTLVIILISGVQYVFRLTVNNIGMTIPYKFFWQ